MSRKKSASTKGSYRKSTPVIRLRRNVDKISRHAQLCKDRLGVWRSAGDPDVDGAVRAVEGVMTEVGRLAEHVEKLVASGFIPPRRVPAWKPAKGEHVRVVDGHRQKYEEAYASFIKQDPTMLDDLLVVEHLSSGEVSVQRGRRTPFLVRKSHLAKISEAA